MKESDIDIRTSHWLIGSPAALGIVAAVTAASMNRAIVLWGLDVLPGFVVGLGLLVAWNLTGVGASAASLSGFVVAGSRTGRLCVRRLPYRRLVTPPRCWGL